MPVRVSEIRFQAGASPSAAALTIRPDSGVVLVGPNNSGKSTALREIDDWCWSPGKQGSVIEGLDVTIPGSEPELMDLIQPFVRRPPVGQMPLTDGVYLGHFSFHGSQARHFGQQLAPLREAVRTDNKPVLWDVLLKLVSIRLDGRSRFGLVDAQASGDLRAQPGNHLWQLFTDELARARVRNATEDAVGWSFVIDATSMSKFHVRMARQPPPVGIERGTDDATIEFMDTARPIADFGDGVQAFTGLLAAIYSLPHRVLLIDEPEAFLHPPLARRLGVDLSSVRRDASLIAATHSADFLMGCLEAAPNTTVVRLTYEDEVPTARAIPGPVLGNLMRDPLLRSTGAMDGVFHKAVVVTEADADRAFYDETNRRLREGQRGVDDALFLNAQNWQTIARIIGPLRQLGVPAAGVLDFDAIAEPTGWKALLDALALTAAERRTIEAARSRVEGHLKALGAGKPYKSKGLSALSGSTRAEVNAVPVTHGWLRSVLRASRRSGTVARSPVDTP